MNKKITPKVIKQFCIEALVVIIAVTAVGGAVLTHQKYKSNKDPASDTSSSSSSHSTQANDASEVNTTNSTQNTQNIRNRYRPQQKIKLRRRIAIFCMLTQALRRKLPM